MLMQCEILLVPCPTLGNKRKGGVVALVDCRCDKTFGGVWVGNNNFFSGHGLTCFAQVELGQVIFTAPKHSAFPSPPSITISKVLPL